MKALYRLLWLLAVVGSQCYRSNAFASNKALIGSNGLPVWLGNRLEFLLVLDDLVSPSGVTDPFTRQRTFVIVTSSGTFVCSSVLSIAPQLLWLLRHVMTIIEDERFS